METHLCFSHFSTLTQLEYLTVSPQNTAIKWTDNSLDSFKSLSSLIELNLNFRLCLSDEGFHFLKSCQSLKKLTLQFGKSISDDAMSCFTFSTHMEDLHIFTNEVCEFSSVGFSNIGILDPYRFLITDSN